MVFQDKPVVMGIIGAGTMGNILKETCRFPLGPFELMDLTGLDVTVPVSESIYNQFSQDPLYLPSPWLIRRAGLGVSLLTGE